MTNEVMVNSSVCPRESPKRVLPNNIIINYEALGACLKDYKGTEDEKKELIDAICWLMLTFVDLGFGTEPTQQALQAGNSKRTSTALPFLDIIMDSKIAGEFNSKNESEKSKEKMTEGVSE